MCGQGLHETLYLLGEGQITLLQLMNRPRLGDLGVKKMPYLCTPGPVAQMVRAQH